jgi:RNase P subunit RPR2
MKFKSNKKKEQKKLVEKNINKLFRFIETNFYPKYNEKYIELILKLSKSFNYRLKREEKLKFCKKCKTPWNNSTRLIRLNKHNKTVEYICKNCGFKRRFKYK